MNLPSEDIHQRLRVARLASPPQVLMRLMTLCQSDDASMAALSELIAGDPSLSAKVLSVAHSAAYHRPNAPPLTLLQATTTLGMALIKVLVISESVFQTLTAFRQVDAVDLRHYWKHSLRVAVLARTLAERQGDVGAEEAYLAGLLHDVGRLVLLSAMPEQYTELFDLSDDASLCTLEQRTLGMSHAEAGAWLLAHWGFGSTLAQSVLHHHKDAASLPDDSPLMRTVRLAHRLAGLNKDSRREAPAWASENGLKSDALFALVQQAALQVTQIARDLGVDISSTEAPVGAGYTMTRPQPWDTVQAELDRGVFDRSVLKEMAMTLINLTSTNAALTSLRQHAGALLQLEDGIVMLARDEQQTLVPVSMHERHLAATPLSFDVARDEFLAQCVGQRKVVFARRGASPSPLLALMDTNEVVLLPLTSAQQCLGVLACAVPPELSQSLRRQLSTLQSFGVYAGLALSRRRMADRNQLAQAMPARQAQQLSLKSMSQAFDLLLEALSSKADQDAPVATVDLSLAVRDTLQMLQQRQLIPGNIEVNSKLSNNASWVQGSADKITQILLILIKNACESMPDGGQIVVIGGDLVQREGNVYTALTLSDSGPSLKEVIQARLLAPLHPSSSGNTEQQGYALNRMKDLVDTMAGRLKFAASPTGTRFDILLPCARTPTGTPLV